MRPRNLVVHVDSGDGVHARLALAAAIARRLGARLTGLFAEVDAPGSSVGGNRSSRQQEQAAASARAGFSREVEAAGVESDFWDLGSDANGALLESVAGACRYFDLAVLGRHDPEHSRMPAKAVEEVVLGCGRPVLVVPTTWRERDVGRRVVVGWNASPEAARALNDAIPLMREAEYVGILAFQRGEPPPGTAIERPPRVVAHLALHGIEARYQRVVEDKDGIGAADTLLNHAFDARADLTVIGMPGRGLPLAHGRAAARVLLQGMATPVLFSH